jgi:hypothetical protein
MANGFHTAQVARRAGSSTHLHHLAELAVRGADQWSVVARSQHQSHCDQIVTVLHWARSFQEGEHGRHNRIASGASRVVVPRLVAVHRRRPRP